MFPRCNRDVSAVQPRCWRDVDAMFPRCWRDVSAIIGMSSSLWLASLQDCFSGKSVILAPRRRRAQFFTVFFTSIVGEWTHLPPTLVWNLEKRMGKKIEYRGSKSDPKQLTNMREILKSGANIFYRQWTVNRDKKWEVNMWKIRVPRLHRGNIASASRKHRVSIAETSRKHRGNIASTSRQHRGCTADTSRLHRGNIAETSQMSLYHGSLISWWFWTVFGAF